MGSQTVFCWRRDRALNFKMSRPLVNFINVKRTNISYERRFGSFFLRTYVEKTLPEAECMTFVRKIFAKNVDEIDTFRNSFGPLKCAKTFQYLNT